MSIITCVKCGVEIDDNLKVRKRRICKGCHLFEKHVYYEMHKEQAVVNSRRWREQHPEQYKISRERWEQEHLEQIRAGQRRWYAQNREQANASTRHWQEQHPEQVSENARRWYENNLDRYKATRKQWRENNLDRVRLQRKRRRRRSRNAEGDYTFEEWNALLSEFNYRCAYCGCELDSDTVTADHKTPLVRGGTNYIENIIPSCMSCNCRKGTKTANEFVAWLLRN